MLDVAVIGGGITGLAAAHRVAEEARGGRKTSFAVFEREARFGGIIATDRRGNCLLEKGPDAFLTEKPRAFDLVRRLGLEPEMIRTQEGHRRSFVALGGRLVPVPPGYFLLGPSQLMPFLRSPLFSIAGRLRAAAEYFVPRGGGDDESVAGFVRRRFGAEVLEKTGQPMLAGIYGGDPEKLSIRAVMPRFAAYEREYGSVIRGLRHTASARAAGGPRYGMFVSFRGGMSTMVDALVRALPPGSARAAHPVRALSYDVHGKAWVLGFDGLRAERARQVIVALPAPAAAELLRAAAPDISQQLSGIRYEPAVTAHFAYRTADIGRPLDGFGFVVPQTQGSSIMGCTFAGVKFAGRAPAGTALLRVFAGGAFGRGFCEMPDVPLLSLLRADLEPLLSIQGEPLFAEVSRWPASLPQYDIGHIERTERLRASTASVPGLRLAGNFLEGVGIPDCVREGESAAEGALAAVLV